MITMPNGVRLFDSWSEWDLDDEPHGVFSVYPRDGRPGYRWGVSFRGQRHDIVCGDKQDAIDIAAMFAEKNAPPSVIVDVPNAFGWIDRTIAHADGRVEIRHNHCRAGDTVKDCDNCGNQDCLDTEPPCDPCLREGNKSRWTPIKAKDCVCGGTAFCDKGCRKECAG